MVQIYLFTELYLVFSACLVLSDTWGAKYFILSNLRKSVYEKRKGRVLTLISGFVLTVVSFFIPMEPGPVFLGDFAVAVTIFINLFHFSVKFAKKDFAINLDKKNDTLGYFTLSVALIHLLFPKVILL